MVVYSRAIDFYSAVDMADERVSFFALASRLEVPLEHISSVEVNPADAHQVWHGIRVGTNLPGVITAGRFLQDGQWAFWDVHDPGAGDCDLPARRFLRSRGDRSGRSRGRRIDVRAAIGAA
jgi:hypothetical protein